MNEPIRTIDDPYQWLSYVPHTLQTSSPLYAEVYCHLEHDPELLALLALVRKDQPIPILFLSCVTFLLFREPEHPMAAFYPILHPTPRPVAEVYPVFRAFCLTYQEELRALLPGVRLQTNEVTRSANLLPGFAIVARRGADRPLALIEIGCSAGLNLAWHHYGYRYHQNGQTFQVGNADAPIQISCTLRGTHLTPLPQRVPDVARCSGLDLAPLDVTSEENIRWLRSCIWPEEVERYHLLDRAMTFARQHPPSIIAGDATEHLAALLAKIPPDETVCLWHSYALNQGPEAVRTQVERLVAEASRARTIFRLALEAEPSRQGTLPHLELFTYDGGMQRSWEWLATCAFHGQHMEWLAPGMEG